jgi:hypothetical protein
MLVGQNKEINLAVGIANDVLDNLGHRVASVRGAENDSAINQDAVGIGARLARSAIKKQSPSPCRYILIFARSPPGECDALAAAALARPPRPSAAKREIATFAPVGPISSRLVGRPGAAFTRNRCRNGVSTKVGAPLRKCMKLKTKNRQYMKPVPADVNSSRELTTLQYRVIA